MSWKNNLKHDPTELVGRDELRKCLPLLDNDFLERLDGRISKEVYDALYAVLVAFPVAMDWIETLELSQWD